ncbi:MAG: LrgB family protein [Angelakisella sp.]|jgi:predicted murein hydrolase (TIGR00659 family)|nr:LrgB family protein [Angelakisella sp.]
MNQVTSSPLFGIALSVAAFSVGLWVNRRTKLSIANPILIAIPLVIACLTLTGVPLADYQRGGEVINMLLGPATAALALSIYRQREILKENFLPVLLGCLAGCCASVGSTLALCRIFGLDQALTASLVPKSVTTPIAVELSAQGGGIAAVTIVVVIFTGICGAALAPGFLKLLRVEDPMAAGVAIGTASHGIGTARALQMGKVQGAMSGVAIGVSGIITVLLVMLL